MIEVVLPTLAPLVYVFAAWLAWKRLGASDDPGLDGATAGSPLVAVAGAGIVLHAAALYSSLAAGAREALTLAIAISISGWIVAALYGLALIVRPVAGLGAVVLPIAAVTAAVGAFWVAPAPPAAAGSGMAPVHMVVAVLAYGFIALAGAQSILVSAQERRLRHHPPRGLIRALPPLMQMERLLFQLVAVAFVLMTLTLASGVVFSEQIFGRALVFSHHVVLSVIAWVCLGVLLVGHYRYGWRGQQAAGWTLAAFFVVVLAYFGTRFVGEVLLGGQA